MAVFNEGFSACARARAVVCSHAFEWRQRTRKYFYPALVFFAATLLFLCGASSVTIAQELPAAAMEYQIKAASLYKFCLSPIGTSSAFNSDTGPFVFGIAAPDNFIAQLDTVVKNHTINDRPVQVRRIDNSDAAGVEAQCTTVESGWQRTRRTDAVMDQRISGLSIARFLFHTPVQEAHV